MPTSAAGGPSRTSSTCSAPSLRDKDGGEFEASAAENDGFEGAQWTWSMVMRSLRNPIIPDEQALQDLRDWHAELERNLARRGSRRPRVVKDVNYADDLGWSML